MAQYGATFCPVTDEDILKQVDQVHASWTKVSVMVDLGIYQLPNGETYTGTKSGYEAQLLKINAERFSRTLDNIRGGPGGTLGFFVGGEKGSDLGAFGDAMLFSFGSAILNKTKNINTSKETGPKAPQGKEQWGAPTFKPELGAFKPLVSLFGGLVPPKKGQVNSAKGFQREIKVVEITNGRLARDPMNPDNDLKVSFTRSNGTVGRVPIDVIGPNGELIVVGGPAKENNISHLTERLRQLKMASNERGVGGIAYFTSDTSLEVINKAKEILGPNSVKTFNLE